MLIKSIIKPECPRLIVVNLQLFEESEKMLYIVYNEDVTENM
jgi:hypothetical protein